MTALQPQIIEAGERKLIGMFLPMSMMENKTGEVWRQFMPLRRTIQNTVNTDLISLQRYAGDVFDMRTFTPHTLFEKWAGAEVTFFENIPDGMQTLTIPAGLFAVFHYKGISAAGAELFRYIFAEWLPASGYAFRGNLHFEILGALYKNNDPDSEEDIWIPIQKL